ncbi:MAG: cyclic nucleotide-binding domain-containing protein [Betaproteobacteria bacterium]|nr:cyclic nucleotide-binding domain-containing protein [Betaproteobacteria bacterium]
MAAPATIVSTAVLKSVPLFAGFPDDQLRTVVTMVTRRSAPRSSLIMAAGDATDSLYVVISGRLKEMMGDAEGKEVILSLIGPGEFFGEMGLIDDSPRSASVIAIEPCELLSLSRRDFKKCMAENFDMTMAVMKGLVRRLREADRKIGSLALLDVYGRVARLLIDMSVVVNGQRVVARRLPKQDIAKMISASREMGSRVMKDLQMGGYIETRGSTIVVRDTIMLPD